nr:unnamed protein product [Meloidogyne enterolobii]
MLPSEQQLAINNSDVRKLAKVFEMILTSDDPNAQLNIIRSEEELNRRMSSGCNDRGMIAWEMQIWTPDSPHGRTIVLISNDITFQMGSFSMREHRLYQKASEYSRINKMPRVYIAANSGARIGFASDIKNHLNIVWNDDDRPEDGFKYLTLDPKVENSEILSQIESTLLNNGNRRIDAIIGKEGDIGVENLVGSGLIAAETSAAYRKVPTYCLVSGRAVGIGAYVARLSHRICQVENSHIILTGAAALNSVLGREVYTSNNQLGGPQIMYHNGVTHSVAHDDMDGIKKILHWITYLPPPPSTTTMLLLPSPTTQQQKLPSLSMLKDDKARMVHTQPTKSAYDPRLMLDPPDGGGLFDKGTFDEIMSGWAKTIIAGRARLRGLAVGVLAVETRTVECEIPADPATQDSQAKCVLQAGQVWHTDSAFKTAEAINDFNHEGLPLIILANIRGFSGGQKDMFEMVLKFGAWIVDALQTYTQPVIIYLPPFGELRGGAWAVLDTQINPTCITMLADSNSRGGVLEANGIVEIKFREKDLCVLLGKCDEKTKKLEEELVKNNKNVINEVNKKELLQEYEKRKEKLLPVCRAAAVKFADLHDTTARMLAKGAIHDEVAWQNTRNYFYNLLCVQSIKMEMAKNYLSACSNTTNLSSSFTIDELEKGCKWVDEHLAETSILIRREINLKEKPSMDYSKRTRFEYFFEQIMEYSNGKEFLQVLEQIKADTLLKQLKLVTGNLEQRERFVAALLERD